VLPAFAVHDQQDVAEDVHVGPGAGAMEFANQIVELAQRMDLEAAPTAVGMDELDLHRAIVPFPAMAGNNSNVTFATYPFQGPER
jgi:hypothetical protein